MDGCAKFFKENMTAQNRPAPIEMAITEFRVRCLPQAVPSERGKDADDA